MRICVLSQRLLIPIKVSSENARLLELALHLLAYIDIEVEGHPYVTENLFISINEFLWNLLLLGEARLA